MTAQGWVEVKMETPAQTAARCDRQLAQFHAALGPEYIKSHADELAATERKLMPACLAEPQPLEKE
jgi:acetyl-CoA carboxylase carboxyltransferase component